MLRSFLRMLLRGSSDDMGDLIHAPGEEALSRFGGSKGAEKFAREGMRFEREPEKVLPVCRMICGVTKLQGRLSCQQLVAGELPLR